ncbi:MAG: preprotein translocase subunit SecG [bacterium]
MMNIINIITGISSVLLIVVILLQQQGSGLGEAYGGSSGSYRSKRGLERSFFVLTIILGVIFIGSLIARLVVF